MSAVQYSKIQSSMPLTVGLASQATQIEKPFVGLVPLDEELSKLLAGREEEVLVLTSNLRAARLTLVYGGSGVGKSSILRAGVVASLRETAQSELHNFGIPSFAVAIMNRWAGDPFKELAESVRDGVKKALDVEALPPMSLSTHPPEVFKRLGLPPSMGATDLVGTLHEWTDCQGLELLIILDQFEEYFLYHENEDGPGTFNYEFPLAIAASDLRVRFLLSLRDDSLYKLDRLQQRIPSLFENRLQVMPMTVENGKQAINKAIKAYNEYRPQTAQVEIDKSLVDEVVNQVRTPNVLPGLVGTGRQVLPSITDPISLETPVEAYIDAPYMQLVMSRIWDEESATWKNNSSPRRLRLETLKRLGGAQAVVEQHLDKIMRDFTRTERSIAQACFYRLVTPSGTKYALTPEELAEWTNRPAESIRAFLEKLADPKYRIVRRVDKIVGNGTQAAYEAHHDRLALAMLAWHDRKQAEQRRRRNLWRLLFGSAILVLLVAFLSVYRESSRRAEVNAAERLGVKQGAAMEKRELEKEITELEKADPRLEKFAALKTLVPKFTCAKAGTDLSSDADMINKTLEIDCTQYEQIKTTAPDALPPRIYIHIQTQEQRPVAEDLRSWLKAQRYDANPRRTIVAGIEYVGSRKLTTSRIRYFHDNRDESDWAWQIYTALNKICIEARPQFIKGFEESDSIRPRHFELWLAPDALDKRCDLPSAQTSAQ
jgi:conflict system STAND superfamily ATPase